MEVVSPRWLGAPQSTALVITSTAVATATLIFLARWTLWPQWPKILPNPLKTTASRAAGKKTHAHKGGEAEEDEGEGEWKDMVYHPDVFPGGRDVETPYGTIRVYEFGPEDGDNVLLVHGISTPCITLQSLANRLVQRGSRVMLFDLFGRGFSDGVGDLPHDARLYVSQILLVLASSPLPWTGTHALHLVGYSLGGALAIHFAISFPHMVSSLVLLAPAGLIRSENFSFLSRLVFQSGLVPERILAHLARVRLQQPIAAAVKPKTSTTSTSTVTTTSTATVAVAEAVHPLNNKDADVDGVGDDAPLPFEKRVLAYIRWMVIHHEGFIPAFMSSIRHAPLTDQHAAWSLLKRLRPGTTLILLAESDEIIDLEDYKRDVVPLVGGEGRVELRVVPGTHDFVITHLDQVYGEMDQWWREEARI